MQAVRLAQHTDLRTSSWPSLLSSRTAPLSFLRLAAARLRLSYSRSISYYNSQGSLRFQYNDLPPVMEREEEYPPLDLSYIVPPPPRVPSYFLKSAGSSLQSLTATLTTTLSCTEYLDSLLVTQPPSSTPPITIPTSLHLLPLARATKESQTTNFGLPSG